MTLPIGQQTEIDSHENDKVQNVSPDVEKGQAWLVEKFNYARDQRMMPIKKFDGLTYEQDYYANDETIDSFLRPKKNDDEVRVNTGLTEKKIESVANEILAMNLRNDFYAFDNDDVEVAELGDEMSDVVKRTEQQENAEDMDQEFIRELLGQRALFVEEYFEDVEVPNVKNKVRRQRCRKRVVSGLQVYLGDITIPAYRFNEQPYRFKYERMSYSAAEKIYGQKKEDGTYEWENWPYVKPGMGGGVVGGIAADYKYRFAQLEKDEVEILTYVSVPNNEYQIVIQAVSMLPPKSPLPWQHEGDNMTMTVLKGMGPNFAYGRPLTASAKVLQSLSNEMIRLLVRKWRQAIEPPIGVVGKKIYSKDIWASGAVTQGARKGDFERLIDHDGVTQSEIGMYQLIEEKTQEYVGRGDLQQGLAGGKQMTATQALEMQRQAIKMLGFAVFAWMRLKRNLSFLRLYNVMENMTKPVGKYKNPFSNKVEDMYKKFTLLDTKLGKNKRGKKIIMFMDRPAMDEELEAARQFEDNQEKPTRIKFINLQMIDSIALTWYSVVSQHESEGSALNKIMFSDSLAQAEKVMTLTGRPINAETLIEKYERTWKEDDMFQDEAPESPFGMQQGAEMDGDQVKQGAQKLLQDITTEESGVSNMKNATGKNQTKPTINTMMGQAL